MIPNSFLHKTKINRSVQLAHYNLSIDTTKIHVILVATRSKNGNDEMCSLGQKTYLGFLLPNHFPIFEGSINMFVTGKGKKSRFSELVIVIWSWVKMTVFDPENTSLENSLPFGNSFPNQTEFSVYKFIVKDEQMTTK